MRVECVTKLVPKTLTVGKIYEAEVDISENWGVKQYKLTNDNGEQYRYDIHYFRVIEEEE